MFAGFSNQSPLPTTVKGILVLFCNILILRDPLLFIAWWGGGRRILEGITWFLGKQKGRSIVTENPKGGITENVWRIQRGDHSNSLGKWRHGGGGHESHQMLLGEGSIQWSNIRSGDLTVKGILVLFCNILILRDPLLFIAWWGGGRRILEGITWFLGKQKGRSIVTEGSAKFHLVYPRILRNEA